LRKQAAEAHEREATGVAPAGTLPAMPAGHYFDPFPAVASDRRQVRLDLPDGSVVLTTDRGVFAAGGPDPGTLVLLRSTPPPPASGDLLDLGCGYGPIACTLARRSPAATVWAVDVNERAVALTASNAAALGLANVVATTPEQVPPTVRFAGIWSNPPIRVGKASLHELLDRWLPRLAPDAHAWLVVGRNLGADSLAVWLADQGREVVRVGSKRGYRILRVGTRS
jgi:16S rRNA (guanine1207-N2)-methyltransferase